jgi:HAD superfamily hydrolase (TIGR01484 family)
MQWKPLDQLERGQLARIEVLLTDIDGTMTRRGRIPAEVVEWLPRLAEAGVEVLPCTGRSAGELLGLVRYLPGIERGIAENGGILVVPDEPLVPLRPLVDRAQLSKAASELGKRRAWQLAPCSFARLTDQAWERAGRGEDELHDLREAAEGLGLQLTWSSVHIHMTLAPPDKGAGALQVLAQDGISPENAASIGDAPNDEGLWVAGRFGLQVGTSDAEKVWPLLRHKPAVRVGRSADGWIELARALIEARG